MLALDMEKEDSFRVGVIVGSGIGSLPQVENNYEKILTKGPGKVNPLMVPMMISNMAAGNISIQLGLRGKCSRCCDSLCIRNTQHRRCVPCDPVWRR